MLQSLEPEGNSIKTSLNCPRDAWFILQWFDASLRSTRLFTRQCHYMRSSLLPSIKTCSSHSFLHASRKEADINLAFKVNWLPLCWILSHGHGTTFSIRLQMSFVGLTFILICILKNFWEYLAIFGKKCPTDSIFLL